MIRFLIVKSASDRKSVSLFINVFICELFCDEVALLPVEDKAGSNPAFTHDNNLRVNNYFSNAVVDFVFLVDLLLLSSFELIGVAVDFWLKAVTFKML